MTASSYTLHAADALLPTGWARDVLLQWDAQGRLEAALAAYLA